MPCCKIKLWPKHKWLRVFLFALAILLVPYVSSRILSYWRRVTIHNLPASTTLDAQVDSLRIVTYNIAHGRGPIDDNWRGGTPEGRLQRLDQIALLLKELNADVVILNEVDFDSSWSNGVNQASYLAEKAGFLNWVEERNLDFRVLFWTWRFGNAVLSRYPIIRAQEIDLPEEVSWETALAGKKRGVLCDLKTPGGIVRVVGTHLSHRSEEVRVASARMLIKLTSESELPLIVAGDLNSTPPGFPHSSSNSAQQNAIESFDTSEMFQRRPLEVPEETGMTYPSTAGVTIIDWILIPKSWKFQEYRVIKTELSDHRPVLAEVERPH